MFMSYVIFLEKTCAQTGAVSNNGLIYFLDNFCCDNFERLRDGNCHACDIGFTSKAGFECTPCPQNTFGFRCADHCQCDESKRCDNVHGCISKHRLDVLSTENSVTILNRTQSNLNNYQTTLLYMTTDVRRTRPNTELRSEIWTTQQSTKEDKTNGFIDQKVLTYMFMAVAGALLVIIGLCLCLICVCWKRHVSSKKKNITASSSAVPRNKFPDMHDDVTDSEGTSGYGYELIDESKLEREMRAVQHEHICVKSLNIDSEVCGLDIDGYLHPYHSLVSLDNISSKGVDDQNNEVVHVCEEKPYLELSAEKQYENGEDQLKENSELINKETANINEDDVMYEVPKHT
ncbi:Hypothetical predicted protein [Mytilus galloprovincialis]|uniref:Uncharacterized protein n=1 Tax=Mytilus galloprovincialis TaxID=29158 RepID=A0A8B6FKN1_MYTGA|nr:Hypothetical predicted protein [Mytilus galloprovincialis]